MNSKKLRKQLLAAIAMTMVAMIALGSSTYAWFINNTLVDATGISVTAQASNTLLISQNTDTPAWGTSITLAAENDFTKGADKNLTDTADNNKLVPVSTIGSANGSTMEFFTSEGWAPDANQNGEYLASGFKQVTDNEDTSYFYMDTFNIKASQACRLYLTKDDNDSTVNGDTFFSGNIDLLETLRLALVVKKEGDGAGAGKTFFYQIGGDGSSPDTSVNTTKVDLGADGIMKAISGTGASAAISSSNYDNGVPMLSDHLATKTNKEALLIEASIEDKDCLYTFNEAEEICTVTAYVWMEGCDFDCNAAEVTALVESAVTGALGFGAAAPETTITP